MTAEQFCYWFQGFLEVSNSKQMSKGQQQIVIDHLQTVFKKVTPNRQSDMFPQNPDQSKQLNELAHAYKYAVTC